MRSDEEIREVLAQELELIRSAPGGMDTAIDRGWAQALRWVLSPDPD